MSEQIEKLLKEYPAKKRYLTCLENQLRSFYGLSADDVIESMSFSRPEGERVQTSNISNKTEAIALNYSDRLESLNSDWYRYLTKRHAKLADEVRFLESALRSLDGELSGLMIDMILNGCTWDALEAKYHISRRTIGRYRRKAIRELEGLYQLREQEQAAYGW